MKPTARVTGIRNDADQSTCGGPPVLRSSRSRRRAVRTAGRLVLVCGLAAVTSLAAGPVSASPTSWWVVDGADDFLKGSGDGVAVTQEGTLISTAGWTDRIAFDEPVVLAADRMPNGDVVVATGHPAKLYRISGKSAELLADLPGEQGTAVLADRDGVVWVATIAPGVLLKYSGGQLEEVGRLGQGGFWDLAWFDGSVVAAAGAPGAVFRVGPNGMERWIEVPDAFVKCLAVQGDRLVVGTSGKGLVLSLDRRGRVSLVVDSAFTEISGLVVGSGNALWATALVGEPTPSKPSSQKDGSSGSPDGAGQETTAVQGLDLNLPKVNGKTATSEVVRITPEGGILKVHRFQKQVATAIVADGDGVLVGTGYEGEVWRFVAAGGARLATLDAVQVTGFAGGRTLLTQGPAAIWSIDRGGRNPSRFRSELKTFRRPVKFGRFRVFPEESGVRIRFRSGSAVPASDLWLPWTDFSDGATGPVALDFGQALQWELEVPEDAVVDRVEVAWTEVNQSPVIEAVEVDPPGRVYLSAPPISGPVIHRENPTFEGVFTTVGGDRKAPGNGKNGKPYWQVGFRTVRWEAGDPNEDPLVFDLNLERADGVRLPVRRELEATRISVDTASVPDGRYRFRVEASDRPANPDAPLAATGVSPWFEVDNTGPEIDLERQGDRWAVTIRDASALARVQLSRDGEAWTDLSPADGVLDGRTESFSFDVASGSHLIVVRAIDRHHNRKVVGVDEKGGS